MARIYKRTPSGPYTIDYWVDGRRIRESTHIMNLKAAERCLASRLGDVVQGKFSLEKVKRSPLFHDFSELYLEWAKEHKKSWERDWYSMKKLLPLFGNRKLSAINPFLVESYRTRRRESVSNATINREVSCLKRILNVAVEWKKLQSNPISKVKPLREPKKTERFLDEEEARRLLTACNSSLRPIVLTALNTGMRKQEILGLTWDRVDFNTRSIRLVETKNGEHREVPLNSTMLSLLEGLPHEGEYVFRNSRGLEYHCIKRVFESAQRKAQINHLRFHDLRHTWASWLIMGGVDLRTIQELGGWKSLSMLQRYTHLSGEHRLKAAETLDKRLGYGTKPVTPAISGKKAASNN
jgi:integrase